MFPYPHQPGWASHVDGSSPLSGVAGTGHTRRPYLHFAHANGFPGACYARMLGLLAERFDVGYLPRSGHDPRFPVTDGWPCLVEELEASIAGTGRAPVIGVGHSLGGYLSFMAAARRPELFRAVILLDAPILGPFTGSALQFVKRIGLIDRVTPAGSTRNRRSTWPSAPAALAHFRRKPLFRHFEPDCLRDYVQHGTTPHAHGVQLAFDPEIEYRIYRTIPHHIADFGAALRVPAGLIHGRHSDIVRRTGLTQTHRCMRVMRIGGGHLFPFEVPGEAAHAIGAMVRQLTGL